MTSLYDDFMIMWSHNCCETLLVYKPVNLLSKTGLGREREWSWTNKHHNLVLRIQPHFFAVLSSSLFVEHRNWFCHWWYFLWLKNDYLLKLVRGQNYVTFSRHKIVTHLNRICVTSSTNVHFFSLEKMIHFVLCRFVRLFWVESRKSQSH